MTTCENRSKSRRASGFTMIPEHFAKDWRVWAELAIIVMLAFVLAFGGVAQAQNTQILLAEDFEGLQLGPNVEERLAGEAVWTDTPPAGWTNDVSGVPGVGNSATDGVTEWAGWAFTDKEWWTQVANNQRRLEFTLGQGTIAVADPDEWDDATHPGPISEDPYDTWLSTPAIDLSTSEAGTAQLQLDEQSEKDVLADALRDKYALKN